MSVCGSSAFVSGLSSKSLFPPFRALHHMMVVAYVNVQNSSGLSPITNNDMWRMSFILSTPNTMKSAGNFKRVVPHLGHPWLQPDRWQVHQYQVCQNIFQFVLKARAFYTWVHLLYNRLPLHILYPLSLAKHTHFALNSRRPPWRPLYKDIEFNAPQIEAWNSSFIIIDQRLLNSLSEMEFDAERLIKFKKIVLPTFPTLGNQSLASPLPLWKLYTFSIYILIASCHTISLKEYAFTYINYMNTPGQSIILPSPYV